MLVAPAAALVFATACLSSTVAFASVAAACSAIGVDHYQGLLSGATLLIGVCSPTLFPTRRNLSSEQERFLSCLVFVVRRAACILRSQHLPKSQTDNHEQTHRAF